MNQAVHDWLAERDATRLERLNGVAVKNRSQMSLASEDSRATARALQSVSEKSQKRMKIGKLISRPGLKSIGVKTQERPSCLSPG